MARLQGAVAPQESRKNIGSVSCGHNNGFPDRLSVRSYRNRTRKSLRIVLEIALTTMRTAWCPFMPQKDQPRPFGPREFSGPRAF